MWSVAIGRAPDSTAASGGAAAAAALAAHLESGKGTACVDGFSPNPAKAGSCIEQCYDTKQGVYKDKNDVCRKCQGNCKECFGPGVSTMCLEWKPGTVLMRSATDGRYNCKTMCPPKFFSTTDTNGDQSCEACSAGSEAEIYSVESEMAAVSLGESEGE